MTKPYVDLMTWIPDEYNRPRHPLNQPKRPDVISASEHTVERILRDAGGEAGSEDVVAQMVRRYGFSRATSYRAVAKQIERGRISSSGVRRRWRRLELISAP